MIDLSVVVLGYRTRDLLLACLRDLEAELTRCRDEESTESEIIVVDNGSHDGTVEAVRTALPGCTVVALPVNVGFAAGMNAGMERASGRIVLLLNSDARATPGAIGRCLRAFEAWPDAIVAGPQLRSPHGRIERSVHAFPSLVSELVPSRLLERAAPHRHPDVRRIADDAIAVDAVRGAAFFIRREALEKVGRLDASYFFFLEETDFCWRVRACGGRVLYVPRACFEHRQGASSKRIAPAATRIEFHRSLYRFVRLHRGEGRARAVVAIRCLRALATAALLTFAAPFSSRQRARLAERVQLIRWHLLGCPEDAGLAAEPVQGDVDVRAR